MASAAPDDGVRVATWKSYGRWASSGTLEVETISGRVAVDAGSVTMQG